MKKILLSFVAILALAACEGVPKYGMKDEAPLSGDIAPGPQATAGPRNPAAAGARLTAYGTAIVKDIAIEERGINHIAGADMDAFNSGRDELVRGFGQVFREALLKRRYFDAVVSEGSSGGAVVVEPRATILDPGLRTSALMGYPTRIEVTVYIADAATGKPLGSYPVSFAQPVDSRVDLMTKLKRYFVVIANRAADGMVAFR